MLYIQYEQLRIIIILVRIENTIFFLQDNHLTKYNSKYLKCKNIHALKGTV